MKTVSSQINRAVIEHPAVRSGTDAFGRNQTKLYIFFQRYSKLSYQFVSIQAFYYPLKIAVIRKLLSVDLFVCDFFCLNVIV